jgi:hypothetical protein
MHFARKPHKIVPMVVGDDENDVFRLLCLNTITQEK